MCDADERHTSLVAVWITRIQILSCNPVIPDTVMSEQRALAEMVGLLIFYTLPKPTSVDVTTGSIPLRPIDIRRRGDFDRTPTSARSQRRCIQNRGSGASKTPHHSLEGE